MIYTTVSGEYYDWTITRKPERPWIHSYHQTFVDKIYLASKANPLTGEAPIVFFTFEQALERIKQIDQVTRGMPKIIYLVGWQYDGHDSKYPDWGEVNDRLKRPQDPTALASLLWLMEEGYRYNTTVSLHINMLDAYEDAPSWGIYLEKDIIVKKDGQLYRHPRAVWGGQQAYWIDYAKEWEAGLAQKRIDGLLEMLPVQRQGTIHIDAFGIPLYTDPEVEKIALRRILRYWRDKGVDVTSENVYDGRYGEGCIGLQPMAWHINPIHGGWKYSLENPEIKEEMWMEIPASLCCGGVDEIDLSTGGLFGSSMYGEPIADVSDFIKPFCLQTLPWYFVNRFERLRLLKDGQVKTLYLSDGVVSRVENGYRTIRHGNRLLVDGEDVFVPALWRSGREIIAYSSQGYRRRKWELPPGWDDIDLVDLYEINKDGSKYLRSLKIDAGTLVLPLDAGQSVSIVPGGAQHLTKE